MATIAPTTAPVFDVDAASFDAQVVEASHSTPVLVDFWASWCGPCKALAPVLEKLARSSQGRFVLAKVDTDANQQLAMAHGIRSLPTVRLFVNGAPRAEFMGAQPESAIRAFLDQHLPAEIDDDAGAAIVEALRAGDLAGARAALQALDEATRDAPEIQRIAGMLALYERLEAGRQETAGSDEDGNALLRALESVLEGNPDAALDGLLDLIARRRGNAGTAREAMLEVFQALGEDSALVHDARRRLASALN